MSFHDKQGHMATSSPPPRYPLITTSGHEEGNTERKEEEKGRGQECPMHLKIQRKECEENAIVFGKRSQKHIRNKKGVPDYLTLF